MSILSPIIKRGLYFTLHIIKANMNPGLVDDAIALCLEQLHLPIAFDGCCNGLKMNTRSPRNDDEEDKEPQKFANCVCALCSLLKMQLNYLLSFLEYL